MTTTDLTVANTILEQLGGHRMMVMTGAKNFVGHENAMTFRLPSTPHFVKNGINYVCITLTPMDTYTVTFNRLRGMKSTKISEHEDVYAEDLQGLFMSETGLATRL